MTQPPYDAAGFWQEPDFVLTHIVSLMANALDVGLGITLMVNGTVITGTLVGEHEYLSHLNDTFKKLARDQFSGLPDDVVKAVQETLFFDELTEDEPEAPPSPSEDVSEELTEETIEDAVKAAFEVTDDPPPAIRHLHLKDPVIVYPNATLSFGESQLPYMRIRLTTVGGWMLGRINVRRGGTFDDYADDLDNIPPGLLH